MTLVVLEPRQDDRPDLSPDYRDRFLLPDWREKRQATIDRQHGKCAGCHRDDVPLQGHHLTYYRFREEGEWDLLAVCAACHPYADRFRKTYFSMCARKKVDGGGMRPAHASGVPSASFLYKAWGQPEGRFDEARWRHALAYLSRFIEWCREEEDGA